MKAFFFIFLFLISTSALSGETQQKDWFHRTDAEVMRSIDSNDWEGGFRYLGGPDYHKLLIQTEPEIEDGHIEELDIDIFYARPFGRYGLWKTGINYHYRPEVDIRLGAGIEYFLPYNIETNATFYQSSDHSALDIEVEREFNLTSKWSLELGLESRWSSKTIENQELGNNWNYIERKAALIYRHHAQWQLFLEYKKEQLWGSRRDQAQSEKEATGKESFFLGVSLMF
jgi:uncharacterized protein involved in copper resistance